jgi:hypothetical protein
MVHLLERTLVLLRSGRFAIAGGVVRRGTEVLELTAYLLQERADDRYGESDQVLRLDYEAPRAGRPGKAALQLGSGRRLEVLVRLVGTERVGGGGVTL